MPSPSNPDATSDLSSAHATRTPLGPSDNSDSGSDTPVANQTTDSDASGTGERASVDPIEKEATPADQDAEAIVDGEAAGLSHTKPNPVKNGG